MSNKVQLKNLMIGGKRSSGVFSVDLDWGDEELRRQIFPYVSATREAIAKRFYELKRELADQEIQKIKNHNVTLMSRFTPLSNSAKLDIIYERILRAELKALDTKEE